MGSQENGASAPLKKDIYQQWLHPNRSSPPIRSRFARFLLFKKLDYLQWICSIAVFFLFVVLFQMFLPGSVIEKSIDFATQSEINANELAFLKEFSELGDLKFAELTNLKNFNKESVVDDNNTIGLRKVARFGYRKPKLALVFADLLIDSYQIQMATIFIALREIGYEIEVISLEDGPVHSIWSDLRFPLTVIKTEENTKINIDWLRYDGIVVNSLQSVEILSCLMQEPFKSIPLIWNIHEQTLAPKLIHYATNNQTNLISNWRKLFNRASLIIYPNYILPMVYSTCDSRNYFVIPGSCIAECEAVDDKIVRANEGYNGDDFIIILVGSQLMYKSQWLDHSLVLQALLPVFNKFRVDENINSRFKIIVLAGDLASNYSIALEIIVRNLGYPKQIVKHIPYNEDSDILLSIADIIIYSSFLEEQSFPDILLKAMCFGKLIIAPDLLSIKKHVDHKINGYIFPRQNIKILTQIMSQVIQKNGILSFSAVNAASKGKKTMKNFMVKETIEEYGLILDHVLKLPSEVIKPIPEIPVKLKGIWMWDPFYNSGKNSSFREKNWKIRRNLEMIEEKWNNHSGLVLEEDNFVYRIWEDQKHVDIAYIKKIKEDEELKDRTEQPRGTWEEVYRTARRVERFKNELHERDEGELERTGQPLTIYEPYFGEGIWPFLHTTSLYRGFGLATKGRRPGADDIDGPSRLPILNDTYYRNVLGEYGAFFGIANRIDRIHKNAWIGFQSWRLTAKKESLTKAGETSLLDNIEARRHGDSLYFWARMDNDPRNPLKQDFWSFCDAINSGNCRFAFAESIKKMYGVKHNVNSLPPMPIDGDSWSVMHSWALPTRSFMEFVMFSRMFVDALDTQFYDEHHRSGYCYLSLSKDKHCYSRMLELLINVWAYHSGRRMVYINPETGLVKEQHKLKTRKGQMWIQWFQFNTIKSLDEDLAEEMDSDHPKRRWLWPLTGEVFWKGIYEKEKNQRNREKEKKKQQSKDKISRIRKRTHQKTIGKYVKPKNMENLNLTENIIR